MIYFFKPVGQKGPIKIGYTKNNSLKRMYHHSMWSPIPLEMIASVDGGFVEERRIHWLLRDDRSHGEWFKASPAVLEFVKFVLNTNQLPDLSNIGCKGVRSLHDQDRLNSMRKMRESGMILEQIGKEFSLTRERVRQILKHG